MDVVNSETSKSVWVSGWGSPKRIIAGLGLGIGVHLSHGAFIDKEHGDDLKVMTSR